MSPIEPFGKHRAATEELSVYGFGMQPPRAGDIIERDGDWVRVLKVRWRAASTPTDFELGARPGLGDFMVTLTYEPLGEEEQRYRAGLEEIYDDARYAFEGTRIDGTPIHVGHCRWCGAPPPDDIHDHDVACPAAKAAYALGKPGYRDGAWLDVARAIETRTWSRERSEDEGR